MRTIAIALAALAVALPATAASSAQPLVPAFIQHLVKARAGSLAYAPTRAPSGYRYLSYSWSAPKQLLTIRLHDKHYATTNTRHTIAFTARPFAGTLASCSNGKLKTIQYDGNKVYWNGTAGWRCVKGAHGNVKLSATGATLPDVGAALVVASGKRL
jgi:hypothetical protein